MRLDMGNREVSEIIRDILWDLMDGYKKHDGNTMRTVAAITLDALDRCQWVKPTKRLPTLWDAGPDGSIAVWCPETNYLDTMDWWGVREDSECLWAAMPMYIKDGIEGVYGGIND